MNEKVYLNVSCADGSLHEHINTNSNNWEEIKIKKSNRS